MRILILCLFVWTSLVILRGAQGSASAQTAGKTEWRYTEEITVILPDGSGPPTEEDLNNSQPEPTSDFKDEIGKINDKIPGAELDSNAETNCEVAGGTRC